MNLTNKGELINFLKKKHLYTKKKLGQNFLVSRHALNAIIKAANIQDQDNIIEVGPGLGVLTQELVSRAKKVTSLELDKALIPILQENFANTKNLEIINTDALKYTPTQKQYKVVANIPYYLTSPLISHFLTQESQASSLTLLVQKEVAEKICTKAKHSILSLQVQLFAKPKYIKTIPSTAFFPQPKVSSAIIHITPDPNVNSANAIKVLNLAKIAFSQKRKMLLRTLEKNLKIKTLPRIFEELNLNPKIRPEDLSIQEWHNLADKLLDN